MVISRQFVEATKIRGVCLLFFGFIFLGVENTGFVDNTGEFFDDGLAVEFGGFFDADEGKTSAAEELFHVFGVTADVVFGLGAVVKLDGADGTKRALITKDEVNSFVFDKTVGFVAVLAADFVAKKGRKTDVGDDVETLTKDVIEELEAVFLVTDHELFTGAIVEAVNGVAATAL